MSDTLDKLLDVAVDQTTKALEPVVQGELVPAGKVCSSLAPVVQEDPKLEDDFEVARKAMKDLIKKGGEAADSAIMLAQSLDEPRGFRVVAEMIQALVTANKELMLLHKTRKETIATVPPQQNASLLPTGDGSTVNIDKAVFVGRASDLLRQIRQIDAGQVDED